MTSVPQPVLALDFGGTKLSAAVVDAVSGAFFSRVQRPTPAFQGAPASLEVIIAAGEDALEGAAAFAPHPQAIGVSFGGPLSRDRRRVLRSMHVGAWEDFDLPDQLTRHFGLPVVMDNDANAAALGEGKFGSGRHYSNLLYIQISTGIGAGLILNGQIYRGAGLAGEFGHTPIQPNGPVCSCGQRGCLESLTSGWAIARDGRLALAASQHDQIPGTLHSLCAGDPQNLTARTVFEAYRLGDPVAQKIIECAVYFLSLGIAQASLLLDPEIIILGGGIARSSDLIRVPLEANLERNLPPLFRNRLKIGFSTLNGDETLLGAALLTQS